MKILVTGCNGQLGYGLRELESYPSGWSWKFTNSNELNITNIENVNQVVKNSVVAGPITINATVTVDGNLVVV